MHSPETPDSAPRRTLRRDLVAALERGLPVEAQLAVAWRDRIASGEAASDEAAPDLQAHCRELLDGAVRPEAAGADVIDECWALPGGKRAAVAVRLAAPIAAVDGVDKPVDRAFSDELNAYLLSPRD